MRPIGLMIAGAALCMFATSAVVAQEAPSAGDAGEQSRPPVEVRGDIRVRPELEVLSGVKGWRVNGEEISLEEVKTRAVRFHGPYILQDLVSSALLRQAAEREGIGVTEEEVEGQVRRLRAELGLNSEEALEFHLRRRRLTRTGFREQAQEYLLLEKVLSDRVYVSDREVERFYNEFRQYYYRRERVDFRLMSFEREDRARAALEELRKGRSFVEVAQATAADETERTAAGQLHSYEKGQQPRLPPEFETMLFAAPLNQAVGPVGAMNRYHLVRVEKKSDAYQVPLEQVRDEIRRQLRRRKLEQGEWPKWIGQQLASANIEVIREAAPEAVEQEGKEEASDAHD